MNSIHFNPIGNLIAALFLCMLPLIIIIIGTLARRKGIGKNGWSFAKRYWYLPIVVPLFLYYAIIYRWLFYDQFYWISIKNKGTWQLEYSVPTRIKTIMADDISSIQAVTGDIWTHKMVRILISTNDGKEYLSAQVSESDKDYYLKLLKKHKNIQ
ncbi:MAG: hypothetical protein ACMUJM_24285 [bacterium]